MHQISFRILKNNLKKKEDTFLVEYNEVYVWYTAE